MPSIDKLKARTDAKRLIKALRHRDRQVRSKAAEALGEIGDVRAVEPLVAALRYSKGEVENAETRYLPKPGRAAAKALGKIGDARAIEPLITALGYNIFVSGGAVEGLVEMGGAAVESLLAALRDDDKSVRRGAAEALGKIGDDRAVDPLIAALEDAEAGVRQAAAYALGAIGDERAVGPLTALDHDGTHPWVREAAQWAVKRIRSKALGRAVDARDFEPVIAALGAKDATARKSAAETLRGLGRAAIEPLTAALGGRSVDVRKGAVTILAQLGAAESLIIALGNRNSDVRQAAAVALGRVGGAQVVEPLIAALEDKDTMVRWRAVVALGAIGDDRAVEPLIAVLGNKRPFELVREAAAEALGGVGSERAVEPLLAALEDEDYGVRRAAAGALGKIGDERAVKPLAAAFNDENERVSEAAAGALKAMGHAPQFEELTRRKAQAAERAAKNEERARALRAGTYESYCSRCKKQMKFIVVEDWPVPVCSKCRESTADDGRQD